MNITQDQISELLLDLGNKENGTQLLMKITFETLDFLLILGQNFSSGLI